MNKSKILTGIIIAVILAGGFILFKNKKSQTVNDNKPLKKITIGFQASPPMALLMVAKDKGFFEQHGLDVELKQFTAGKFALQAFLGGSLDYCVSGDVPATLAALQGNKFVIPAQVVSATKNEVRVVAAKDGNLTNAKDYFSAKKRKFATSAGGGPEFFTYEFLNKLGISKDQVEIIAQKPEDMPAALASGSVDAISVYDPYAYIAEKQLGDKAITLTDPDIYSELYVIEAKESIKNDPTDTQNLLRALLDAEKFIRDNPDQAKQIVANYTKLDRTTLDNIWGNSDFSLSLTPLLLEYAKRETLWAQDTGKIKKDAAVPDLRNYIYDIPLKAIAPSAVGF